MNISGISASDTAFGGGSAAASSELGRDAFMSLLVEQLKNQDPLQPTANQEFIAELTNFSSLEEMQELNENLLGMVVLQQSNALLSQLTESSALIGKQVRYFDSASQDFSVGAVESVKIQDGLAVLKVAGQDVPLADVTEVLGSAGPAVADTSEETPEA